MTAINADARQIRFLISQAENAIATAITDGDMTKDEAIYLQDLQAQSTSSLALGDVSATAASLSAACTVFE